MGVIRDLSFLLPHRKGLDMQTLKRISTWMMIGTIAVMTAGPVMASEKATKETFIMRVPGEDALFGAGVYID